MLYDVVVIGGGVIGCALLRELTAHGYSCVLLEKNELVSGASAGNSAHAISYSKDVEPGSLEATCLRQCRDLNRHMWTQYELPRHLIDTLMVAWTPHELGKLPGIVKHAHQAGVVDCRQVSAAELRDLEPELSQDAMGGVIIPGEAVIDPHLAPVMLAHVAMRAGARVECGTEVTGGELQPDRCWLLTTSQGSVRGRCVVNAAGLHGDEVENLSHPSKFQICPRKGQYAVFGPEAGRLIRHIIVPIPTAHTKGILISPTVYGNLLVGPTAEDVRERQNAVPDPAVISSLTTYAHKVLPALRHHDVIGSYAGLRPATEFKDYQISLKPERSWVTVGGIRSTGVSACLAIAKYVCTEMKKKLGVQPSFMPHLVDRPAPYWWTDKGSLVIDGVEYKVTHPITKFGWLNKKALSKL